MFAVELHSQSSRSSDGHDAIRAWETEGRRTPLQQAYETATRRVKQQFC